MGLQYKNSVPKSAILHATCTCYCAILVEKKLSEFMKVSKKVTQILTVEYLDIFLDIIVLIFSFFIT